MKPSVWHRAARIALTTQCPVIPCAQWGPQEILAPYARRPRLLPRKAPSLLVPVIITNPDAFTVAERTTDEAIKAGAPLFQLTPSGAAAAVHVETSGQPNAVCHVNVHLVAQNSNPMPKQ